MFGDDFGAELSDVLFTWLSDSSANIVESDDDMVNGKFVLHVFPSGIDQLVDQLRVSVPMGAPRR